MDTEEVVARLKKLVFSDDEDDLKEATELHMATMEQCTTGKELTEFVDAIRGAFQLITFEELGKPELMDQYSNGDAMEHLKRGIANTYIAGRFVAMLQPLYTTERYQRTLVRLRRGGED
jgi:hypothetical protein